MSEAINPGCAALLRWLRNDRHSRNLWPAPRCLHIVLLATTASRQCQHCNTYGEVKQTLLGGKGRTDRPKDSAGPTSSGQMPASVRAAAMPRASISTEEPMTGSTCPRS